MVVLSTQFEKEFHPLLIYSPIWNALSFIKGVCSRYFSISPYTINTLHIP